jgi:hypothetical protein
LPKLSITSLSKTFGEGTRAVTALRGVDLAIGDNEFLSLVGTSGCGKSTLLSIVAGLESHDQGDVLVDGVPVEGPGLDRGVVFQSYTLFPWLTAQQNVEFALREAGMRGKEAADAAADHLKLVGLDGFAKASPRELSGGLDVRPRRGDEQPPGPDQGDHRHRSRAPAPLRHGGEPKVPAAPPRGAELDPRRIHRSRPARHGFGLKNSEFPA